MERPLDPWQLLAQVEALKDVVRDLARDSGVLRAERDIARAKVHSLLPRATPEEEEECRASLATAVTIDMEAFIRSMRDSCDEPQVFPLPDPT